MKRFVRAKVGFAVLVVIFQISALHTHALGQLRGFVVDSSTSEPIAGASVRLIDRSGKQLLSQSTHTNGEFRITLVPNAEAIQIHTIGFSDTTIHDLVVLAGFASDNGHPPNSFTIRLIPDPLHHETVTITAQRHLEAIEDVPVSVSTIDAREIQSRAPQGLDNVLRYIPGVSMTDKEVNIRGSSGYARSIGSRVLLLLDGMPFLTADNGDIDFDVLPLFDVDRIEVVKGAGSALYGSSALGGVVNVITRSAPEGFHGAFQATGGRYDNPSYAQWVVPEVGRKFGNADIGGSGNWGDVSAIASAGYMRNEGYRLGDDYYRWHAFAKFEDRLSESSSFGLSGVLANEDHGGWLYWKSLSQPLMPSDSLSAVNARVHSFKSNVLANYSTTIGDFLGAIKANLLHTQFVTDESQAGANDGNHSSANAVNLELDGSVPVSDLVFLTTGLTSSFQSVSSDLFQDHHGLLLGAFAQGEFKPTSVITATAGVRYDHIRYDQLNGDGQLSPKAGISYQITPDLSARTSYGYGFRAPAIAERFTSSKVDGFLVSPNPNLLSERSNSYEYGMAYSVSHWKLDGSVFYSTFDHLIQPTFVTPSSGNAYIQFQNITKALLFGHEEVVEWYPLGTNQILVRGSYTYVFPQDEVTKQILEFRPRHLFQAHAEATVGIITGGLDFRYVSPYETFDSTLAILVVKDGDSRVAAKVLDARIGVSLQPWLKQEVEVTLQALNLLNYYYVEIVGNMAPTRSYSLQIQSHF